MEDTIVINGVTYKAVNPSQGRIKIVILQRGHVAIGRFSREENDCIMTRCAIIRIWGTTRGLGELVNGPTEKTVLDKCGNLEFDYLTVIAAMDVEQSKWESAL